MIVSHIGLNPETQEQMIAGELEVQLVPQGTLVERIAPAAPAWAASSPRRDSEPWSRRASRRYAPTAINTCSKRRCGLDYALVHALICDYLGNLAYALTAQNFNPLMATAADTVIVYADHLVPLGVIAPDHVITPAPLVDYVIAKE